MISLDSDNRNQAITLQDGRTLGYAEYGDPEGRPVFLFHGQPGNRLFHPPEVITRSCNVRLIVPDRPGYGLSTFQPNRKIIDWVTDVQQLADDLQIVSFPVIGYSAGGPYALASAAFLPDQISSVVLISSAPPMVELELRRQMSGIVKANYFLFTRLPWLAYPYFRYYWKSSQRNPSSFLELAMKNSPPADQYVMEDPVTASMLLQTWKENLRIDPRGYVDDARLLVQDWGFELNSVRQHGHLVWGSEDGNSPPLISSYFENILPLSSIHLLSGEGHFGFLRHWDFILGKAFS